MRGAALASESTSTHPEAEGKGGPEPKLGLEDWLLMLFMYYQEYRTFTHLGVRFGISQAQSWGIVTDLNTRLLADCRFHVHLPGERYRNLRRRFG